VILISQSTHVSIVGTDDNQKMINAGQYLIKFTERFYKGLLLSIFGIVLSMIFYYNFLIVPSELILICSFISLAGTIVCLLSVNEIRNAGKELIKGRMLVIAKFGLN